MNKLPRVLKGFNAFINGDNQHGVLVEITRPKIARKTEDYTPGGGMGEMTIVHGFEKLELEITSKGYDADILRQMQSSAISGTLIRYQGALQQEDGTAYTCSLKLEARLKEERAGEEAEGKGKNGQA